MKKLLLFTVVIGLLACGMAFSEDWRDGYDDNDPSKDEFWAIHKSLQIDRVGNSNTFTVSLTDFIYDGIYGGEPLKGTYMEVWGEYTDRIAFDMTDVVGEKYNVNVLYRPFFFGEVLGGDFDKIVLYDASDAAYVYYDIIGKPELPIIKSRLLRILGEPGISWPVDTPLFSFEYSGTDTEFVIYDRVAGKFGSTPIPAGGPAPVPEPATLLGFGVPMLMVGLGRLRNLRK